MEAEGGHHDRLIRSIYPQTQSIILALVAYLKRNFPHSTAYPAATESSATSGVG